MSNYIKGCPLLVQSDTHPSMTLAGESHTRSYMLRCLMTECAAYADGECRKFGTHTDVTKSDSVTKRPFSPEVSE